MKHNDAATERGSFYKLKVLFAFEIGKNGFSLADGAGIDEEMELIDKPVFDERRNESGAAVSLVNVAISRRSGAR